MTVRLIITAPPSTNNLYSNVPGRGRTKSPDYRIWLDTAGWELKQQRPKPVSGPVSLTIACPENNRRDLGNHEKPATDLLVSHGIIESDRCKTVRAIDLRWHDSPAMLIEIRPA